MKLFKHCSEFYCFTAGKSGDYEEVRDNLYTKLLGNGTLFLQHVKEDREGYYLCQAENGIGTGIGKVIQLRVNCKLNSDILLCRHYIFHPNKHTQGLFYTSTLTY